MPQGEVRFELPRACGRNITTEIWDLGSNGGGGESIATADVVFADLVGDS